MNEKHAHCQRRLYKTAVPFRYQILGGRFQARCGNMGKGNGPMRSRVTSVKSEMPFKTDEGASSSKAPRSWKSKQRMWMMAGLKKLHAPIATWFQMVFIV